MLVLRPSAETTGGALVDPPGTDDASSKGETMGRNGGIGIFGVIVIVLVVLFLLGKL